MFQRQPERRGVSTVFLVFALMFAVFGFGLHARTESIRTGASTTAAKLSVQKQTPAVAVAATVEIEPSIPLFVLHLLYSRLGQQLPSHEALRSLDTECSLRKTSGLDSQGPSSMLRPPPTQL